VARQPRSEYTTGLLLGVCAYGMWGLFPLYFPLLKPASALEILAHRVFWTLVFMAVVVALRRSWGLVREQLRHRRSVGLLAIAAVAVSSNWGVYIWAVNNGHVVEASLGYFINPIVVVLIGVLLLKERLRRAQWVAVGLGLLAVLELTVAFGRPPFIALALALTFAAYGLVRKLAAVPAVEGLTIETAFLAPFAIIYIAVLASQGQLAFGSVSVGNTLLLACAGVITAVPLLAFGGAVNRIPLSMIGLLQYITPVLQFSCGVFIFKEEMSNPRWLGFGIVWVALMVLSWDAIRTARNPDWKPTTTSRAVAEAEEEPDYTG